MVSRRRTKLLNLLPVSWNGAAGAGKTTSREGVAHPPEQTRLRRVIGMIDLVAIGLAFIISYPYPILPYLLVLVVITSLKRFHFGIATLGISLTIMAGIVLQGPPGELWDPGMHNIAALAMLGCFCLGLRAVMDELERQRVKEERLVRELSEAIRKLHEGERQQAAAQEQLLRSERLAALGQFSATVAHELRNPLNVVKLSVQYVTSRVSAEDEKLQRHLTNMNRHVDRASEIISDLLAFARFPPPALRPTAINDVVCRAIAALPVADPVRVDFALAAQLPLVMADPRQIEQALQNLGQNALQAMPDGGRLAVQTRLEGPYVEIAVRDTGVGVDASIRDRIFEPFFSTKVTGTGLGLPLVHEIAAAHGGRVRLDPLFEPGACFVLQLPLIAVSEPSAISHQPSVERQHLFSLKAEG